MAIQLAKQRLQLTFGSIVVCFLLVIARLFYWQVVRSAGSQLYLQRQSLSQIEISGKRGNIYAADGQLLVSSQTSYDLYVNKKELAVSEDELVDKLVELYQTAQENYQVQIKVDDTTVYILDQFFTQETEQIKETMQNNLARSSSWLLLLEKVPPSYHDVIQENKIVGLHLFEAQLRYYPEGSMAAHLTGFVGKDEQNRDIGYFGLEGGLERELQSHRQTINFKRDGRGLTLPDQELNYSNLDGRNVTLTLRRDVQLVAERALEQGVDRFQSQSGEIIVLDPQTGAIMALATWPHYDPANYSQYSSSEYKNPALANLYEPGSVFKIITLATGIDLGLVEPETQCPKCDGPRIIGRYTINTWNKVFNPNITMIEALRKSDNTAMVYVSELIGAERFMDYIKRFGIGEALDLDLQEDRSTPLPNKIGAIELATMSFGQGISTNSLQMVRAVGAIANKGVMMKPYLVKSVHDPQTNEVVEYLPQKLRQVISSQTAQTMTQLMIHSAPERRNWINQYYLVAGKSGTSQIPSETGGYKDTGTVASYIGFAPADSPKFVMMVKLNEPQADVWGATTAVPIWYEVADQIMLLL